MCRTSKTTALLLAITCALALLLTGCDDSGQRTSSNALELFGITKSEEVNLLDIANDYLSGEPKLPDLYTEDSDGWVEVNATEEWFKPGAVYPYETWTPDDIIASYTDKSAPWTGDYSTHHLWSADYSHVFAIKSHIRCYIDGEYVGDVPHRQYSMDPQELIQLYQAGEWDGLEPIWSEDDSTYVTVQWNGPNTANRHRNGCLIYEFENFTEEVKVKPWWRNDNDYEVETNAVAYTTVGEGEDAFLKYDEALVPLYVDLPNGELTDYKTFGVVVQIVPCSSEDGVLVYTSEGIWLFKAGKLVLGWPSIDAIELYELGYQ